MFLAGRNDVLENGSQPTIMTSYGGHGVAMTPQFSVFVAFAMEQGCVFALPNIRGGSEFGASNGITPQDGATDKSRLTISYPQPSG